jgi:hypothetical protein
MKIWKLSITDTSSPHAETALIDGPIIVRAATPDEARELVGRFSKATKPSSPYEDTKWNAWSLTEATSCEIYENSGYSVEGDKGILEPSNWKDY